ncbi:MAG: diaminopimelate epimerase [Armatimonadota bacterium]|nr:diaminopimelate epimerase [Armatimonadota bacterium]MDR7401720.1 diaminopimelate epimerase [Armatimonadota bacterium]MDR7404165.1 diaminopimelate epimerase [Armatimonadota bacterium]MDR7436270.1 diaminopimelate epimerase [Armatimonadota bacterium]MDR7471350.1 diaminopimelate epimerase [Armatimonadota bacterium]
MERDRFVKSHALGNDYIIVDPRALSFPLTEDAIRLICDRHRGVGSDGILALVPSSRADFGVRIYNPDGSEAEKSGNGLRILARYLYDHGLTRQTRFRIETAGGVVEASLEVRGGAVESITVDMGRATFRSDMIPAAGRPRDVVDEEVEVDGERLRITAVSVGNPHCVVFTDDLRPEDLRRVGPRLERHPLFPRRTNVQLARVLSPARVAALIWERGAGETLASGSSACAVAAAAVRKGVVGRQVTVSMPGGDLQVAVSEEWDLRLTGPAEEICTGTLSSSLVARVGSPGGAGGRRGERP